MKDITTACLSRVPFKFVSLALQRPLSVKSSMNYKFLFKTLLSEQVNIKFDCTQGMSKIYLKIHIFYSGHSCVGKFIYLHESACLLQQDAKLMLNYRPDGKGIKIKLSHYRPEHGHRFPGG